MSLQFVVGSSGTGKSTMIYNKIIEESIANPKRNYIIIVPEQFTLLTQKELVRLHPNHVIMNIDVLSFNRLAYRVFDELGIETLDVLEETGKNLLIRKIAMDKKEELSVLSANINKTGYISEIKSFISELSQYNISADDFSSLLSEGDFNKSFMKKASDIAIIYKAYEEFIKDRYITAEGLLVRLNEVISDSKFLSNSEFVFDGFTGFTPLQNELLKTILKRAYKSYVVVTMDGAQPLYGEIKEYELFAMSKKMISKTRRICELINVDIEDEPIICDKNYRFKEDGYIDFIEKHLFRVGVREKYDGSSSVDKLSIHCLPNPRLEIEYVACKIAEDVRSGNGKYKDIAICVANLSDYKDYFESIFDRYNIPFYLDASKTMVFHPLIEFVRSAFLVVDTNFSYESVIQFLRCNLTDITIEEIDVLDNYLSATKVRGVKAYKNDFAYEPDRFKGQLHYINDIRKRFADSLIEFYDSVKSESSAKAISESLYKLFNDYNVESKIEDKVIEYREANNEIKAAEYSQIYKIMISIIDKIVTLLGDEIISSRDYIDIMMSACEGAKITTIPASDDSVVIGDLERTRYDKPKAMYILGVNDGTIPANYSSTGIISQTERVALKKALEKKDSYIAPTDREKSFMQRFYIYMILTKASDKLCITYSASDSEANALNRSYMIDELLDMFSDVKVDVVSDISPEDYLVTVDSSKRYVSSALRHFVHDKCIYTIESDMDIDDMDDFIAALGLIDCNKDSDDYNSILDGAFYYHNKETIDSLLYNKLVDGDNPVGSVSRLETYRKCAYNYFLNYCLGIKEQEKGKLQNVDYGSIYHDILEDFSNRLKDEGIRWKALDDNKREELLDKSCDKVYKEFNRIELLDTIRDKYTLHKIKATVGKTVEALVEQAKHSKFEPYKFEVQLSEIAKPSDLRITLEDGREMMLQGRIDRIDTFEDDDTVYVKIIDYKSGNTDIDYTQIYNGLQLQLIYYLDVSVRGMSNATTKNVKPAAMFYYKVKDPIVEYVDDSIEEAIKKDMVPKGLFFEEEDLDKVEEYVNSKDYNPDKKYSILKNLKTDIAKALDDKCEAGEKSLYAPYALTKNGYFNSNSSKCCSINDINKLEGHVHKVMKQLGSDMYSGKIDSSPVKDIGCNYCPYGSICEFDIRQPGYNYSEYVKLDGNKKKDDIYRLINN